MLSLPSVNSTPSVVSRPVLMVDAALRPAAAARVIEPTTAISKERSRVETRSPEGLAKPVVQGPAAPAPRPAAQAQAPAQVQSPTYGVTRSRPSLPPQAEPTPVQKAVETQIKELFGAVWKASGKAVDFLLGRPEPTPAQVAAAQEPMSAIMWSLTAAPGSRFSQAALAAQTTPAPSQTPERVVELYSPKGTSELPSPTSRGQLLDVQA